MKSKAIAHATDCSFPLATASGIIVLMPSNPQAGGDTSPSITQVIAAQDHWYVNFTDVSDGGHNNHPVIAWIVTSDNKTMYPMISSPVDQKSIVAANTVSENYVILNPYSHCMACVRPEPAP